MHLPFVGSAYAADMTALLVLLVLSEAVSPEVIKTQASIPPVNGIILGGQRHIQDFEQKYILSFFFKLSW